MTNLAPFFGPDFQKSVWPSPKKVKMAGPSFGATGRPHSWDRLYNLHIGTSDLGSKTGARKMAKNAPPDQKNCAGGPLRPPGTRLPSVWTPSPRKPILSKVLGVSGRGDIPPLASQSDSRCLALPRHWPLFLLLVSRAGAVTLTPEALGVEGGSRRPTIDAHGNYYFAACAPTVQWLQKWSQEVDWHFLSRDSVTQNSTHFWLHF